MHEAIDCPLESHRGIVEYKIALARSCARHKQPGDRRKQKMGRKNMDGGGRGRPKA